MKMHKALHPRDDVYSVYESRKEGGRGLANIKDSVYPSIQNSKIAMKNAKEDCLQWPETIQTTNAAAEQKYTKNKNGKKNNYMDILRNR